MIDKRIFSDTNLSWKAKGILGYFLSRPDNWTIIVADLIKQSTDGRDSVYSGLKELIKAGYIVREAIRESGKILKWEYIVFEEPQINPGLQSKGEKSADRNDINAPPEEERIAPSFPVDKPQTPAKSTTSGFSRSGKPRSGKSDTTNNDLNNNDLTNNVVVEYAPASNCQQGNERQHIRSAGGDNSLTDNVINELQVAIRKAAGAQVDASFLQKLAADFPVETIREKIKLMGNMGRQKLRNVPGLLIYLLEDDSRHIPGRPQGQSAYEGSAQTAHGDRSKAISINDSGDELRRRRREILKSLYLL